MPWSDRTGPRGYGPLTGRGLGYCAGYFTPEFTKGIGMGMGWGGGWGRGRGRRWGYFDRGIWGVPPRYYPAMPPEGILYLGTTWAPQLNPEDETKYLESLLTGLKKEIDEIENRIKELKIEKEK